MRAWTNDEPEGQPRALEPPACDLARELDLRLHVVRIPLSVIGPDDVDESPSIDRDGEEVEERRARVRFRAYIDDMPADRRVRERASAVATDGDIGCPPPDVV